MTASWFFPIGSLAEESEEGKTRNEFCFLYILLKYILTFVIIIV